MSSASRWHARLDALHDRIAENWLAVLGAGTLALVIVATAIQFLRRPFYVSPDSALFQHGGWYITQGATPYVDFFDIKPPLIYVVTTLLALVSGGNMAALHVLSVGVAVGAIAAGITLVGVLNYRLTGDGVASVAAGATMIVIPTLYTFPWAGVRPKYLAFTFGVLGLVLAVDEYPLASGAAGAIAAGFWQLAAPFAALAVAVSWSRLGLRGLVRAMGGGVGVAALVVLPFVLSGTAVPLFLEAVVAPIYGVERYTLAGRLLDPVVELGYGILLVPIGAIGWATAIRAGERRYRWVAAGGVTFLATFALEMGGAIDAIPATVFLALGVGYLVSETAVPSRRVLLLVGVLALAASSLYWAESGVSPVRDAVTDLQESVDVRPYASLPADPAGVPSMRTIYWEQLRPDTCHYRLDHKQKAFVRATGGDLTARTCGQWPFERPPAAWLVDAVMPG